MESLPQDTCALRFITSGKRATGTISQPNGLPPPAAGIASPLCTLVRDYTMEHCAMKACEGVEVELRNSGGQFAPKIEHPAHSE